MSFDDNPHPRMWLCLPLPLPLLRLLLHVLMKPTLLLLFPSSSFLYIAAACTAEC